MPEARHTQSVSAGTQHAPTNEDSPGGWMSDGTAPVGLELALELLPVLSVGLGVRTRSGILRRGFS